MISRRSSGSSCAASAVEPTRSQNITVSWRRSAEELGTDGKVGGSATRSTVGVGAPAAADTCAPPVRVSAVPQSPQNLLPDGFSAPHAAQCTGSGAPQLPQTFFPSRLALPLLGQSMPHLNLCQHRWLSCNVGSLSQS